VESGHVCTKSVSVINIAYFVFKFKLMLLCLYRSLPSIICVR